MNYARHYQALMDRAESRVLDGYSERHHVVPRCVDKMSTKTVRLTPEEHYVAHQLLVKMHPENRRLVHAAVSMTMASETTIPRKGNKLYGWLRRAHAKAISERLKGRKWSEAERIAHGEQWNKGLKLAPLSEEQKKNLSEIHKQRYIEDPNLAARHSTAMKRHYDKVGRKPKPAPRPPTRFVKGQQPWNEGKSWSPAVLDKMRKPRSPEGRAAIAAAAKARGERQRALSPELKARQEIMRLEKFIADLKANEKKDEVS